MANNTPCTEALSSESGTHRPFRVAAQHAKHFSVPFDGWPLEFDAVLIEYCRRGREGEHAVIETLHQKQPELPRHLIWARIVYLRLTKSKRPPYQNHIWTTEDDEILRQGYRNSRNGSIRAIDALLERYPDWSQDSVMWRAKKLGLARARTRRPLQWTPQEDEELLSLAGYQMETILKRLKRSRKSILSRLAKLGWGAEFFGGYKLSRLADPKIWSSIHCSSGGHNSDSSGCLTLGDRI